MIFSFLRTSWPFRDPGPTGRGDPWILKGETDGKRKKESKNILLASWPCSRMTCPDILTGFLVSLSIPDPGLPGLSNSDWELELLGFEKLTGVLFSELG